MSSLTEQMLECEKKLLDPVLRRSPQRLATLLADDFVEFGSSGRTYDKKQVLYRLGRQLLAHLTIEDFRAVELAPGAALVTYRARAESQDGRSEKHSLRSSLWVQRDGQWQMLFHQGTIVPAMNPARKPSFPFKNNAADT